MIYDYNGKQVLRNGKHFADAATPMAARLITEALNAMPVAAPNDDPVLPLSYAHTVRREGDEFACSCGGRWDAGDEPSHR